ncbi:unnamed protein product [Lactuca saligna]|uniref:Uncharacterized protein n=1 Tax=Lactuca saligna TaxID=75948 RepID=A0AA35ZEB0_LACSI|nr:unnamed protein product [Lactuca saligna]
MQETIDDADKPNKGGRVLRKVRRKLLLRKVLLVLRNLHLKSESQPIRNEEEEPIHNEEVQNKKVRNEEGDNTQTEEPNPNLEVTQSFNDYVPSPPPSPTTFSIPIIIASCPPPFSSSTPFQIRTESEEKVHVTKGQLQSLHENIDQLILSSKSSSSDAYAKAVIESLFEMLKKDHSTTIEASNKAVADFYEICKSTTERPMKLWRVWNLFKTEKAKLHEIRADLKTDHEYFQSNISSQVSQLKDTLATKSNLKASLSVKNEEASVLRAKLEASEKNVNDFLFERALMRSCITDVTSMLSNILETRDSMLTISVRKYLFEKVRPVFALLHRLEGVRESGFIPKQGGEGISKKTDPKMSRNEPPKYLVKPIVKKVSD